MTPLQRKVDQERLDRIAPRQVLNDPPSTWRARLRIARLRLAEVVRWAGRNNGQQPVQVVVNLPPQAVPPPTATRVYPTDGGMNLQEKLDTLVADISKERDFARTYTGPPPPKPAAAKPTLPQPRR